MRESAIRYRSTTNINLPFRVQPIVEEIGKSRVEYTVHVKANFQPKLSANNVVIKIPTPLNTANVDCKVTLGKAKYVPAENVIVWKWVPFLALLLSPSPWLLTDEFPSEKIGSLDSKDNRMRLLQRKLLSLKRRFEKLGVDPRSRSISKCWCSLRVDCWLGSWRCLRKGITIVWNGLGIWRGLMGVTSLGSNRCAQFLLDGTRRSLLMFREKSAYRFAFFRIFETLSLPSSLPVPLVPCRSSRYPPPCTRCINMWRRLRRC